MHIEAALESLVLRDLWATNANEHSAIDGDAVAATMVNNKVAWQRRRRGLLRIDDPPIMVAPCCLLE